MNSESTQPAAETAQTAGDSADVKLSNGTKDGKDLYREETISSTVDMYYALKPSADGNVMILNPSSNACKVSVTKLKVTSPDASVTPTTTAEALSVSDVPEEPMYIAVNSRTLAYARSFNALNTAEELAAQQTDVGTETPTDEPEIEPTQTPTLAELIKQMISSFVSNLFGSVSRLFGR